MNDFKNILDEIFNKETITDVSFNGKDLYIQDNLKGRYKYKNEISPDMVENYIKQLVYENNQKFNDEEPILDSEYPKLRINSVHKTLSTYGTTASIRSSKASVRIKDYDTLFAPIQVMKLLEACVKAKCNILISGITGSGKTELQKYLCKFISDNDKIVLIEDTLDSHLKTLYPEKDIFSWKTNEKLENKIGFDQLIKAALRNNPNWIIISETRGSEAYSMLKSALSGHNIITTLHSKGAKNNVERLIHMCREKYNLDQLLLGNMIADIFDIGIHLDYEIDELGVTRYIVEVVEYLSYDNNGVKCNSIFEREVKINKNNDKYEYLTDYKYNYISDSLYNKLVKSKVLSTNINIFVEKRTNIV